MKRIVKFFRKCGSTIITIVIVVVAAISMNVATAKTLFTVAHAERGYAAVGGEWVLAFVLCILEWRLVAWCSRTFWKHVRGGVKRDF